MVEIMCCVFRR